MTKNTKQKNNQIRPPVVVILGHVDHGKTSILDYIRETKVADRESGGITQHVGAYQVEHNQKTITFLDTPGHEAFSAMRSRGAKVADIAILVVAADEGLKPQTKEAIDHIKKIGLPTIIALNKIDKKEALPEKVKNELASQGLLVESLNGDVLSVDVSAKTGQGIDQLLENISLVAEMEEFKANPDQSAHGVIIESHLDQFKGSTATLLVKDGTLKKQDIVATDSAYGKIKSLEDFKDQGTETAGPSCPVSVIGFNQVPQIGEKFKVFTTLEEAQAKITEKQTKHEQDKASVLEVDEDKKVFNIILKTDVQGSLEAIRESLKSIPDEEVVCRIMKAEVGKINETDIKLAESAKAKIFGFRVKADNNVKQVAQNRGISVATYEVIYELIQDTREAMANLLDPEIIKNVIGQLKILAIFANKKGKQVIGGRVSVGQAKNGALFEIIRDKERIGSGKITQLQHDKQDTPEVPKGQECGLLVEADTNIEKSDVLEMYEEEKKKKTL